MASFHRPKTTQEAIALLAMPGARLLAGGASLVAMMNAGLLTPEAIVSLKDIEALRGISVFADGSVRIGAMTRHRETAENRELHGCFDCLRMAAGGIANPVVRNMGTMGGSVSLADPGADYPAALVALGAMVELEGPTGRRRIPARKFFVDWYATAAQPQEMLTSVVLPSVGPGVGYYRKLTRVTGDFAIVSVALCLTDAGGVSIAIGGCGPGPIFSDEANALIAQRPGDTGSILKAGEILAKLADPVDDVRASADYRRLVIPRLLASAFSIVHENWKSAA